MVRCVSLGIVALLLTLHAAMAQPPAPPAPEARNPVDLSPYFETLIDRDGALDLEAVRRMPFQQSGDGVPNLGYTDAALWLRFRLPEPAVETGELLFEIRFPLLDRIEFYAPQANGAYRRTVVGDRLPWRMREVQDRNYVFRLPPTADAEFYLRVRTDGALLVPAYLWRAEAFASHSRRSQVAFGLFYGFALALILYNLMLFLSVRDRAYLYYVLYGITFAGWLLAVDGFTFEYLGPEGGWWPNNGLATSLSLSLFFGAHFARRFLDMPRLAPWANVVLHALALLGAILAVCGATGWLVSYRTLLSLVSGAAIVLACLIVVVAVRAVLSGNRTARFFLFAWTFLLAGLVVFPLRNFGFVPYNFATFYSLHIGFALDLVLLSFALGDRINIMRREADLARSEARAMQIATRHKSEFLANMSHELRTPLNAILGFSELLRERYFGELTAKQAEYVNDIRDAGGHLLSLINDILDLSKVEAGRMELDLSEIDLAATIDNAITLVRERAMQHGIGVEKNIDAALATIRADERKVKQILLNLLSNAVKFTPDGGRIVVAVRVAGPLVEVSVSDTGVGIAPEEQKFVFEEFRQVGKDAARKAEGTGLGLALSKRFVELHGGAIHLESALGKGTTFLFTLPALPAAALPKAA